MSNGNFESSKSGAAAALGKSVNTFTKWLDQGAPEKRPEGYDIDAIRSWAELSGKPGFGDSDNADDEDVKAIKLRKLIAETEFAEAKAAKEQQDLLAAAGEVYNRDDVERKFVEFGNVLKRMFSRLPQQVASEFEDELKPAVINSTQARLDLVLRRAQEFLRESE